MIYLADTNILLRFSDRSHTLHGVVRNAIRKLRRNSNRIVTAPQNCVEFWNVATRPAAKNGFGFSPSDADRKLRLVERIFPLLNETPLIYPEWRRLVVAFGVSGVQVHDARIVAAMIANSVTHVLTFNTSDFVRYASEGIVAIDPASV